MRALHTAVFVISLLGSGAYAASFTVTCNSKSEIARRGCTIKLTGTIEPGDALRLRQIIREPLFGEWHYNTLVLDSPGGNVQEAIQLAGVIREAMLQTSTTRLVEFDARSPIPRMNWACVSACFLVWVAGTERFSMSGYTKGEGPIGIGLHRPYFSPELYRNAPANIAEAQQTMTSTVREYLRREQIPEQFIEKMLERSSREVYWLRESGDDFALNGRAAWFEEMMIARCKFDPVYDRESQAEGVRLVKLKRRPLEDPAQQAYFSWRQEYNACEYQTRRDAQAAVRSRRPTLP